MQLSVLVFCLGFGLAAAIGRFPPNVVKVGVCYQRFVTIVSCLRCNTAASCPGNLNCCPLLVAPGVKCCAPSLHAQSQVRIPDNPGRRDLGTVFLERLARWMVSK